MTVADLPAMEPCQSNPNGVHRFEGLGLLEGDKASLTWLCRYCGALRQVAGFGPLYGERLDDLEPGDIDALVKWERRA